MLLGNIKGQIQVVEVFALLQAVVVNELWTMAMDKGTESQTILEAVQNTEYTLMVTTYIQPSELTKQSTLELLGVTWIRYCHSVPLLSSMHMGTMLCLHCLHINVYQPRCEKQPEKLKLSQVRSGC